MFFFCICIQHVRGLCVHASVCVSNMYSTDVGCVVAYLVSVHFQHQFRRQEKAITPGLNNIRHG